MIRLSHARLILALCLVACRTPGAPAPFQIEPRYWIPSATDSAALASTLQRIRTSIGRSLANGVLAEGFPRDCTVVMPEVRTTPFVPDCVENDGEPDALLLDDSGRFIQFVPIDYLSERAFLFEIYLLPDAATAGRLDSAELLAHPHVAVTQVELPPDSYREWLSAMERGIRAAGAEPLGR